MPLALMLPWKKRGSDKSHRAGMLADLPASHDPPWLWDAKALALVHYGPLAHAVRLWLQSLLLPVFLMHSSQGNRILLFIECLAGCICSRCLLTSEA